MFDLRYGINLDCLNFPQLDAQLNATNTANRRSQFSSTPLQLPIP
jgi:hypothetical protein